MNRRGFLGTTIGALASAPALARQQAAVPGQAVSGTLGFGGLSLPTPRGGSNSTGTYDALSDFRKRLSDLVTSRETQWQQAFEKYFAETHFVHPDIDRMPVNWHTKRTMMARRMADWAVKDAEDYLTRTIRRLTEEAGE